MVKIKPSVFLDYEIKTYKMWPLFADTLYKNQKSKLSNTNSGFCRGAIRVPIPLGCGIASRGNCSLMFPQSIMVSSSNSDNSFETIMLSQIFGHQSPMTQHNIPKVKRAQCSCDIKSNLNQDGIKFVSSKFYYKILCFYVVTPEHNPCSVSCYRLVVRKTGNDIN